jgi:hypothetical protein
LQDPGKQDDQQQRPPEDRHGIADKRRAHDRLVATEPRLTAAKIPAGNAERDRDDDGAERQLQVAGNSVKNSSPPASW